MRSIISSIASSTHEGVTLVWQAEAGKPFVALLIGIFATLLLLGAAVSALCALALYDRIMTAVG